MGMIIRRNNSPSYNAYGGYIEGGYFILGNRLGYDRRDALPLCLENKNSLAIFVRVNHTNLNDSDLKCGALTDLSAGMNYYLNKHIIFRLNYSHVKTDQYSALGKAHYNVLQSRIQIKFWVVTHVLARQDNQCLSSPYSSEIWLSTGSSPTSFSCGSFRV